MTERLKREFEIVGLIKFRMREDVEQDSRCTLKRGRVVFRGGFYFLPLKFMPNCKWFNFVLEFILFPSEGLSELKLPLR